MDLQQGDYSSMKIHAFHSCQILYRSYDSSSLQKTLKTKYSDNSIILLLFNISFADTVYFAAKVVPSADGYVGLVSSHHDLLAASDDLAVAYSGIEVGPSSAPADCWNLFDVVGDLHKALGA